MTSIPPEVTDAVARLAELAVRNTAGAIWTRVQALRARNDDEAAITELIEIINELVDEKAQLVSVARALEEQLIGQRIADNELEFITQTMVPTLERLMSLSGTDTLDDDALTAVKELLSKETFSILQLVGFNFKSAIGQPLTEVVERLILRLAPASDTQGELAVLAARQSAAIAEAALDADATTRLRLLFGQ